MVIETSRDPQRGALLWLGVGVSAATSVVVCGWGTSEVLERFPGPAPVELQAQVEQVSAGAPIGPPAPGWQQWASHLEELHGIAVVFAPPVERDERITCEAPTVAQRTRYLPLLAAELSVYPREFLDRSGIERIVVCRELVNRRRRIAAAPDWEHGNLYYDADYGSDSLGYQRRTLHHELFHMVDHADGARLASDPAWAALNASDFHYGVEHVAGMDEALHGTLDAALRGFLDPYAMTHEREDKAELFCYLVLEPEMVARRAAGDRVLFVKVVELKKRVIALSPAMAGVLGE